ncbi:MAG: type II toxin-antitoxin system prevent-host-death family antitoxin [Eubacterium sp.]
MIQIRPVSDLRNKFTEIENTVKNGAPVYLTKNGYGSMVVMSIEAYSKLTESIEDALDVADKMAEETNERYSHEEMFAKLREAVHE